MADAQAQDRAHRIGQKNEVRVFRLITTTPVEERILARANDKKNLTGLVVEAGKFNARSDSHQDDNKEMMESLMHEWMATAGNANNAEVNMLDSVELIDDEDLNAMMATYEGETQLYEKIDESRKHQNSSLKLLELSEKPF